MLLIGWLQRRACVPNKTHGARKALTLRGVARGEGDRRERGARGAGQGGMGRAGAGARGGVKKKGTESHTFVAAEARRAACRCRCPRKIPCLLTQTFAMRFSAPGRAGRGIPCPRGKAGKSPRACQAPPEQQLAEAWGAAR